MNLWLYKGAKTLALLENGFSKDELDYGEQFPGRTQATCRPVKDSSDQQTLKVIPDVIRELAYSWTVS